MLILYHGHSEFLLESAAGFSLLTDPYDAHVGYPMGEYPCDAVTVTHSHGDHSFTQKALGAPAIVDSAGVWQVSPDVHVTAIPGWHDDAKGAKRGPNLLMKIEMDGLTLCHLGDLGCLPDPMQVRALGKIDVLMIPVGGYFTMDAETAKKTVDLLRPRIVIPMHYKTKANGDWPIAGPEAFLRLMNAENISPMPLLRVTKEDLSEQPTLALLEARP